MTVRHVVTWRLSAAEDDLKSEHADAIRAGLQALPALIDGIRSLEVGVNSLNARDNWDLVLIAEYDDADALAHYATHPAHLNVAAFIRSVTSERASVDFEV